MARKQGNTFATVLFTTIVAPITVSFAVKNLDEDGNPQQVTPKSPQPVATLSPSSDRVIARGTGGTPEEALQHALRTALHIKLSSILDPHVYARHLVIDTVLMDSRGLIVGYEDLHSSAEQQQGRMVYYRTLSVSVSSRALGERVREVIASLVEGGAVVKEVRDERPGGWYTHRRSAWFQN